MGLFSFSLTMLSECVNIGHDTKLPFEWAHTLLFIAAIVTLAVMRCCCPNWWLLNESLLLRMNAIICFPPQFILSKSSQLQKKKNIRLFKQKSCTPQVALGLLHVAEDVFAETHALANARTRSLVRMARCGAFGPLTLSGGSKVFSRLPVHPPTLLTPQSRPMRPSMCWKIPR